MCVNSKDVRLNDSTKPNEENTATPLSIAGSHPGPRRGHTALPAEHAAGVLNRDSIVQLHSPHSYKTDCPTQRNENTRPTAEGGVISGPTYTIHTTCIFALSSWVGL